MEKRQRDREQLEQTLEWHLSEWWSAEKKQNSSIANMTQEELQLAESEGNRDWLGIKKKKGVFFELVEVG